MKWEPNQGINDDERNTYYEIVTIIPCNEIVGSVQNKDNIKFGGGVLTNYYCSP